MESPDAITPMAGGQQLLRYQENEFGAAVGYRKNYGIVAMGFPFETILDEGVRVKLMQGVFKYLGLLSD